jgi:hypothetical protein
MSAVHTLDKHQFLQKSILKDGALRMPQEPLCMLEKLSHSVQIVAHLSITHHVGLFELLGPKAELG